MPLSQATSSARVFDLLCRQLHTDTRSDHMLWLTIERMEWHRVVFRANRPAARDGHACALHEDR